MDLALSIARSGLEAQHENIEIISNNLANSSTTAFKRSRAEFADLPYQVMQQPGSPTTQDVNSPSGVLLGTGTKLIGNTKIYSDGALVNTDNPLNIAIQGRGFLEVQMPNGGGFAYTRAGSLNMNEQGQLTLSNGYIVQPPITLPTGYKDLTIGNDGTVTVITSGSSTPQQIGQIELYDFVNPDGLQPIGDNLYLSTVSSGSATSGTPGSNGYGQLRQGQLEGSNVNVVEEMVNLIEAQRAFEMTSKAVSTEDNMMEYLNKEA